MGQEIVYCFKCQIRLLGSDFERGKAFRIDSQAACPDCVRTLLADLPDPDAELERLKKSQVPRTSGGTGSSTSLPPVRPGPSESGTRRQPRESPAAPASKLPLVLAGGGGVLLLLVLFVTMLSGPKTVPPRPESGSKDPDVAVPLPSPPRLSLEEQLARELEELDARTQPLLQKDRIPEAAGLIAQARGKHSSPVWSRGIEERLQKIEAAARRIASPVFEQLGTVVRKGDAAQQKELRRRVEALGVPALLSEFDQAVAAAGQDPWIVLDLRNFASDGGSSFLKRPDGSILVSGPNPDQNTYTAEAQVGLRQVRAFRLEALPDPALPSGGPGRAENGNIVLTEFKTTAGGRPLVFSGASADHEQDRYPSSAAIDGNPLTGWAVGGRLGQASTAIFHLQTPQDLEAVAFVLEHRSIFARHTLGSFRISAAVLELPPPPPPRPAEASPPVSAPVPIPPGALAFQKAWAAAAGHAAARDLASAAKALEDARPALTDEAARKDAAGDVADFKLAAEALAEVPRLLPRWTRGTKLKLEWIGDDGTAQMVEGAVLESGPKGVSLQSETGLLEVPSGELGAQSIAALLALRGEKRAGDGRALAGLAALEGRPPADLPKRFSGLQFASDSTESEARRTFWGAEEAYAGTKTRGQAGATYAALLEKKPETAFVARNRAFLEDRLLGTRDLFLFPDDLSGAGTFLMTPSAKAEGSWISNADSAPGKAAPNFLEAELFIQPATSYRAWVYAGGCCQEVFTFFLQGSGLSGPSAKNPKETVTAEPGSDEMIAVKPPSLSLKKKHSDHTGPKEPDRWTWVELGPLRFAEPGVKKLRILTEQKGFAAAYLVVSAVRQAPPRDSEVKELLRNRPPPESGPTGTILREIWKGIPGTTIAEFLNSPKFKEKPDLTGPITFIDSWDMGTDYGCRIRGYVHPPSSGDYVFWIASDDEGELWLSSDDTPANKKKICSVSHAVGQREWNADPSQQSAPVVLSAGKRYYIEALQKQGGGPEHVAVGWQLPGGALERPIPPPRLSPVGALPARRFARRVFRSPPLLSPEGPVAKSAAVGAATGLAFEQAPTPRQFLRGVRYSLTGEGSPETLQPLYIGPAGPSEGARVGGGNPVQVLAAPPGYAVAGMVVRGTDRVNAFKVLFMRVSGARLVPTDRYDGEWVGSREGGPETLLGGDGTPVLGIFGASGAWIDRLGLLLLGK